MQRIGFILTAAMLAATACLSTPAAAQQNARQRVSFQLAPTGLPQQITVAHDESELPLDARGKRPGARLLQAIGRGPMLRGPIVLSAVSEGGEQPAAATKPARPQTADGVTTASSQLKVGPVSATLNVRTDAAGRLFGELTYGAGQVDALELVIPLAGDWSTLIVGDAVADKPREYAADDYVIPGGQGEVWGNAAADSKDAGPTAPGPVTHMFVGAGDHGLTWLADAKGWNVDNKASTAVIERAADGNVTWRIRLVNHKAKLGGRSTVRFALLAHPARFRPADPRRRAWLNFPDGDAKTAPLSPEAVEKLASQDVEILRADAAAATEASPFAVLTGPAGGDAISAEKDLADTYPMPLFTYLSGAHTGVVSRLSPNSAKLVPSGGNPSPDRVAIGRALVNDIGLDAAGLADLAGAANVVAALEELGFLAGDGKTEFIPYWRAEGLARYGEAFDTENPFETAAEDPTAGVYVAIFRRPLEGGKGYRAVFVLLNERDEPVREQFYMLDPAGLFGGKNALTEDDAMRELDLSPIPDGSDWRPAKLDSRGGLNSGPNVLIDALNHGTVRQLPDLPAGTDVYGPLFVPAHGIRIVYGQAGK